MKTELEILNVTVVNREDAYPPSKLTVTYKPGWWHLPLLHVPLALDTLKDGSHDTRKAGQITLVQEFPSGKAPKFRVKGRGKKLEVRLHAGPNLRARAKVTVGDLVSYTAERLMKVPFKENVGGKVAGGFLSVGQLSPVATPPPPDPFPFRDYKREDNPPALFPLGQYVPTQARLQFLVKEMYGYGPMPNPKEWLAPPHSSPSNSLAEEPTASQSPQISPGDCDEDFRRLWVKVFGEPTYQQEHDGKGTQQSSHITPTDCDADFVRLWTKVFGDHNE